MGFERAEETTSARFCFLEALKPLKFEAVAADDTRVGEAHPIP
jgi:hypothetical protein